MTFLKYTGVLLCLCTLLTTPVLAANSVYQSPEQFIDNALGAVPKAKVVWLKSDDKKTIADILNHKYDRMRIRYWQEKNNTVWILEEIGKEKPITIGVHIKNNEIITLKVLIYRESRGDEVRHAFFTDQFNFAKLTDDNSLNTHIDGITGATLSVRALTKVASMALWLHEKVMQP